MWLAPLAEEPQEQQSRRVQLLAAANNKGRDLLAFQHSGQGVGGEDPGVRLDDALVEGRADARLGLVRQRPREAVAWDALSEQFLLERRGVDVDEDAELPVVAARLADGGEQCWVRAALC